MEELIKITGQVRVQLFSENGKLKQEHTDHNLIVTVGKTYLMSWLAAASQAGKFMSYVALGSSAAAPVLGNTTLGSEITGSGNSRVVGILTSGAQSWTNTAAFIPGNCTGTINEAGLFSASSSGTMFARQTFSTYTKGSGDTLVIIWTIALS